VTAERCLAIAAGTIGSTPIVPALGRWYWRVLQEGDRLAWGLSAASVATLVVLFVASIMQMAARTYNPFIYFRF
jgi:alginate O-acetyltransferase complex protein AlgI